MIEKREFGRTGRASSVTIFGAAGLKQAKQAEANRTLEVLLEPRPSDAAMSKMLEARTVSSLFGIGT